MYTYIFPSHLTYSELTMYCQLSPFYRGHAQVRSTEAVKLGRTPPSSGNSLVLGSKRKYSNCDELQMLVVEKVQLSPSAALSVGFSI